MSLILNYTKLLRENNKDIQNFSKKIHPIPHSNTGKSQIYVILFLNNSDKISKNIKQLNDITILDYYFIKVNHKNKLCKINDKSTKKLPKILECLKSKFNNFSIMCYLDIHKDDFKDKLNIFTNNRFTEPIIIEDKMCLTHCEKNCDIIYIKEKVEYALTQYFNNSKSCELQCKFSQQCLKYLKQICYTNDNEVGGEMYISKIENGICIIDVLQNKTILGTKDSVQIPRIRINFHSHPKKAYETYGVKYGWPSATDFNGFFDLRNDTIFHCVTTLEGIYIMYFNEFWNDKLNSIPKKFINKNYDFNNHRDDYGVDIVLEKINNVKYKNHPVINVKLLKWEENNPYFKIFFKKCQNSCSISQQMFVNYKKTL
jgi:hypothetical protein